MPEPIIISPITRIRTAIAKRRIRKERDVLAKATAERLAYRRSRHMGTKDVHKQIYSLTLNALLEGRELSSLIKESS